MLSQMADEARQVVGQGRQAPLPSSPRWKAPLLGQQFTQLLRQFTVLVEKSQQTVRRIQASDDHND
jgi:hypothetical protein